MSRQTKARRRRWALIAAAAIAFAAGAALGGGCGGGGGGGSTTAAKPPHSGSKPGSASTSSSDVPTVTGFDGPVPVLMYHAISPPPPGDPYPDLFVPEAEFEDQMKWLDDHGYHGVTLDDVFKAWHDGAPIAKKPVVISFDDGLQSQFVGARPMLDALGWPGVLNLAISHLDSGDMTADQVNTLVGSGWEIDSHTFSHVDLTEAGVDLDREVAQSRTYLQKKFDVPVDFFCYPAGRYDDAVVQAVQNAGYLGATTTVEGLATPDQNPFELERIRVDNGDGAEGLAQKLSEASG